MSPTDVADIPEKREMIKTIHILNGPNLNLIGIREPDLYGDVTFEHFLQELRTNFPDIRLEYFQSNHEGALIDELHRVGFNPDSGIVLNGAGLSHTSVSLRDAVAAIPTPVVEVHISDIHAREPFRWHSYLTDACVAQFTGLGLHGYQRAVEWLRDEWQGEESSMSE